MPSVGARLSRQLLVAYGPHTSVSGDAWQIAKRGTTSSAGAAGGTTLVDATNGSGGADTYNGYFVRILSGTLAGAMAMVVDDDGNGTLTLEEDGFSEQVASGVSYEIVKSPIPIVVVDSSGGETNMVDAGRIGEGDSYWLNYYAVPLTGARKGRMGKVTAFTSGTGTFTLAAGLGGALAAGDVVLLMKFIETTEPDLSLSQAYEDRPSGRVLLSRGDGSVLGREGTFGFQTEILASGALQATPDSEANRSVLQHLFVACGLEEFAGKSVAVGAGATTTAVTITTGKHENFRIGQAIQWKGNTTWITAKTDGGAGVDTLTVSPPLPKAPAAADIINASRCYLQSTDGDYQGVWFIVEMDGVRHIITGCKGNVALQDAAKPMLAWSFSVDNWIREKKPAVFNPGAAYSTVKPTLARDRLAYLDTTAVDIEGFTASANAEHTAKPVMGRYGYNGRAGFHLSNVAPGASFRTMSEADSEMTVDQAYLARTAYALAVAYGSHGECVTWRIPVARLRENPQPVAEGGLLMVPHVMQAQDAGVAEDGANGLVKVPDFSISVF